MPLERHRVSDKPRITDQFYAFCWLFAPLALFVVAANIWPYAIKTLVVVIFLIPAFAYLAVEIIRISIKSARLVRVAGHLHCPNCGLQFGMKAAKKAKAQSDPGDEWWIITCRQCNSCANFGEAEEALIDPAKEGIDIEH